MLQQAARLTGGALSPTAVREILKTRFGEISIDPASAVLFSRGLLGMPNKFRFALAQFPNPKMQQFMLLQSLEEEDLSFITLPLDLNNAILSADDIRIAAHDLQIPENNLALLLIASVHRSLDGLKLSVNARAPLLIDVERKIGAQYVFQHDHYKVQHPL